MEDCREAAKERRDSENGVAVSFVSASTWSKREGKALIFDLVSYLTTDAGIL